MQQREIKFRALSISDGEWKYGHLCWCTAFNTVIRDQRGQDWACKPGSQGQYTGLKDKNGKEIYEGDIVRCVNEHVGAVEWEEHDCCFNVDGYYGRGDDYPTMAFMEGQPFEVIGNVFEHPELLK